MATQTKSRGESAFHSVSSLLGLKEQNTFELIGSIQSGLPFSALDVFQSKVGLLKTEVSAVIVLPASTLSRKKKSGQLTPPQSERLVRLAKLYSSALELFEGDEDEAREWLKRPREALGGQTPLEMAKTELGAREVENLILALEQGVFL